MAQESIGRYRVDAVVGSGTFATVYRAWDDALDVTVAIKVLAQNWSFDADVRRRFITEAQLLRRAHGTRVVRVHDIGETDDGRPYFVMDYAERGTVEDRLAALADAGARPSVDDVLHFARALADAVSEVHRLGVVHRDLKPSNLLLRAVPGAARAQGGDGGPALVGADEQLVVGDLGFAREIGATRLTAAVGTEEYMAPEQRNPAATIDARADVYAATRVLERVLGGVVPEPLAARGLAADPAGRYPDMSAWLDAVESALAGGAPPDGQTRGIGRGRGALAAAGVAIAVVAAVVALAVVVVGDDDDEGPTGRGESIAVHAPPSAAPVAADDVVLVNPLDLAVGADGALYVAEFRANRVRVLDADGGAATIAGSGAPGSGGDGGPAVDAQLFLPTGVGTGPDGSVYVADSFNGRVRRVAPDGTITTVAGNGASGEVVDGSPATDASIAPADVAVAPTGEVYVTDPSSGRVWEIDGDGRIRAFAELGSPSSVATDSRGRVYVSDAAEQIVVRIDDVGDATIVAGRGTAGFSGDGGPATEAELSTPDGLAVAPDGALLIADTGNRRVRRVGADGTITTIAGGGELGDPTGVAVASDGRIYVVDNHANRVLVVDDGNVTTFAGTGPEGDAGDNGPATEAAISTPRGIAFDAEGNFYVAEALTGRVRQVHAGDGRITTVAGMATTSDPAGGDGGAALDASLAVDGVAVDGGGFVYVTDGIASKVRFFRPVGSIATIAGTGEAGFSGDGAIATAAQLSSPLGVAVAPDGSLLVADSANQRVRRVASTDGTITTIAGTGLPGTGPASGAALDVPLSLPFGVAVDGAGAVYVTENVGHRVRRIDPDGTIVTIAGTGTAGYAGDGGPATRARLSEPAGVAVDPDGRVYVAELAGHRVRRIDPDGTIVTVAGTGIAGFSGDGAAAADAQLAGPTYLAIGPDRALYVADTGNNRVRRIDLADGTITTVAGRY